jgi:hypothetical protein
VLHEAATCIKNLHEQIQVSRFLHQLLTEWSRVTWSWPVTDSPHLAVFLRPLLTSFFSSRFWRLPTLRLAHQRHSRYWCYGHAWCNQF